MVALPAAFVLPGLLNLSGLWPTMTQKASNPTMIVPTGTQGLVTGGLLIDGPTALPTPKATLAPTDLITKTIGKCHAGKCPVIIIPASATRNDVAFKAPQVTTIACQGPGRICWPA